MFSASITDAVLFSTKRTCVISTQKQDRKCSAEPAEIIRDILKNLKVCVRFPLSLSCPEAARILLSQKEKVHFITKEKKAKEEVYDDFDYFLFTALMDTRNMLIDIIQDRAVPMQKRLWKLLAAAHDFQLCVNKNELFKWEEMRKRHEDSGYGDRFCNKIYSRINADNIENSSAASACANTPEQLFKKNVENCCPGNGGFCARDGRNT